MVQHVAFQAPALAVSDFLKTARTGRRSKLIGRYRLDPSAPIVVRRQPSESAGRWPRATVAGTPIHVKWIVADLQRRELRELCQALSIDHQSRKTALLARIGDWLSEYAQMDPATKPTRVFISYSHDSAEHRDSVLQLANRLRADGVDARIDRYYAAPEEGWARWMQNQLKESDYVLLVGSSLYKQRFEGHTSGDAGRGVNFEGALATQMLYSEHGRNTRFIPILIGEEPMSVVPTYLQQWTVYRVPNQYDELLRRLTGQPEIKLPEVGTVSTMPTVSVGAAAPRLPTLRLVLDADADEVEANREKIRDRLREVAGGNTIDIIEVRRGSAELRLIGSTEELDALRQAIEEGHVVEIKGYKVKLGATKADVKGPPWLDHKHIRELALRLKSFKLDSVRSQILQSLPGSVRARLDGNGNLPTLLGDLTTLNGLSALRDGESPLGLWLEVVEILNDDFDMSILQLYKDIVRSRTPVPIAAPTRA